MTAQDETDDACPSENIDAAAILRCLSAEERVGQLFLVTVLGDSAEIDSPLADLIKNYHIGGVVLDPRYDNLSDVDATAPENLRAFTRALQIAALEVTLEFDEDDQKSDTADRLGKA